MKTTTANSTLAQCGGRGHRSGNLLRANAR
jgi:hypothetical protein